ncbi:MAG: DUF4366 domain-containing protein [Oscillospiraceae bacterium]|jgi:hypothetical protein|nr:DUF4366 domain-containing protein [Oscillospiraceae bacterium]
MALLKTKLPLLFALVICVAALFLSGITAYAYADGSAETLSVDEVWLTGDILHIAVTDKTTGDTQTLELNLSDYAKSGDELVTIQAADNDGNTSNVIQFRNPYYDEQSANGGESAEQSESSVPDGTDGLRPFTYDGTGEVVDNAADGDGKEFFSISTEDGNVFYLIVDRQRTTDNVYFLNAVTEDDLVSLAKPGDGQRDAVPTDGQSVTPVPAPTDVPEVMPVPTPAPVEKTGAGTIVFIILAVIAVGGAGYYFKIVRPGRNEQDTGDYGGEPEDEDNDDTEDEDE